MWLAPRTDWETSYDYRATGGVIAARPRIARSRERPPSRRPLMAASPLALEKALALPAVGAYTITPKLVNGGPATVTATTVSPASSSNTSNAKTVTVSTTTTSGSTAFNAFTDFTVGKGVSVNLVIPTGTKNLVNTVDNPVVINGTIYSTLNIGNGSVIAGHVFFLAPNGFLLGPDGSINVGALTVATSKASLANTNTQSSSYGQLDLADFPTSAVLSGTVPLDGTGTIDIQGKIDAPPGSTIPPAATGRSACSAPMRSPSRPARRSTPADRLRSRRSPPSSTPRVGRSIRRRA